MYFRASITQNSSYYFLLKVFKYISNNYFFHKIARFFFKKKDYFKNNKTNLQAGKIKNSLWFFEKYEVFQLGISCFSELL